MPRYWSAGVRLNSPRPPVPAVPAPTLAPSAPVILVESDPAGGHSLHAALAGHRVSHFATVEDALPALRASQPQLVVLGIRPSSDGRLAACADARTATPAPILLCAVDRHELKLGFRLGADDVVQTPLDLDMVRARAEALVRRGARGSGATVTQPPAITQLGAVSLDLLRLRVTAGRTSVPLTPPELRILSVLAERRGIPVSREELSRLALEQEHVAGSRSLDMHVRRLRAKLLAALGERAGSFSMQSVRGTGYRLVCDDVPPAATGAAGPRDAVLRQAA